MERQRELQGGGNIELMSAFEMREGLTIT